ncbi:sugar-binding transcriptional regulator [Kineococcus gynurae]|uniref:Sugar-binding transcriptional regulator n=1 Tax=Kineococcus gynurae TaxID=452979 RepID=A0ABV5LP93_9ACTN
MARLYHVRGLRQSEIAERLHISQSRVSRLLSQAEAAGVVRTIVVLPTGLHSDLEDDLEQRFGLREAHVVEAVADDEDELARDLGHVASSVLAANPLRATTVGYTSWSRTLRHCVEALAPGGSHAERVVELLGDLGSPALQHEAAQSTEHLAHLLGATPLYLRTPGVLLDAGTRAALLDHNAHAQRSLSAMDDLDVALVGIGPARTAPPLGGDTFFTDEQFARARELGAVGEVCLRFLDADGHVLSTPFDDLVVGVTAEQLASAGTRFAVAGGQGKHAAILAALRGRWVDVLVTDTGTAEALLAAGPPA